MWNIIHTYIQDFDWMTLFLYGVFFILAAILIILVPEILVALIAGMLLIIGAVFIYAAWQLRKAMNRSKNEWIEIHYMD